MKQCIRLIQTNKSFQKSVNLQLDLGNYERIGTYIPTRSQVAILGRYLAAVSGTRSEHATVLIGPYGKGKSHLLLVLLALLAGPSKENRALFAKIEKAEKTGEEQEPVHPGEERAAGYLSRLWDGGKKYLPVLISPVSGGDLNEAFTVALSDALMREGLGEIAPESYYSEALRMVDSWKKDYSAVYRKFEELLGQRGMTAETFCGALRRRGRTELDFFRKIYPELTAGSVFAPLVRTDALLAYRQTGRILTEEYGYAGIYIVFDEFSKYMEGHAGEGFSGDMRTLQDMCELANGSGQGLFLTLVAHKSIHEYRKGIPAAAKNAFRGVEGRLSEVEFIVSAQNHYELIADALIRQEPEFSRAYDVLLQREDYRGLLEESFRLPCFGKLFSREVFLEVIAKGCFPMVPLFNYALLHISERVAQNERTVFTFLAGDGQGSLKWLLSKGQEELIGIDKIYDYFHGLFRETADEPLIHNEWMKAEYALSQSSDGTERAVIKAIAIIRMIRRMGELPAKDEIIRAALALGEIQCRRAIASLKKKGLVVYRSSIGVYAFRNRVGVDIEKEIQKKVAESGGRFRLCDILEEVSERKYELPKQYNQKYAMTRYFQYVFMETEDFLRLTSAEYLFEEVFSDGKMIVLIQKECDSGQEFSRESMLQEHLDELKDARVLLLVPDRPCMLEDLAGKYLAVQKLAQDQGFTDGNQLLMQELALYGEDIAFEINAKMEKAYLPEHGGVRILQAGKPPVCGESVAAFGALLSGICEEYYSCAPKVNHELLNVRQVGTQYLRARNRVVKRILEGEDVSVYERGTSPEAMVYRAAFVHTKDDRGYIRVSQEIGHFFQECAGRRGSFETLYARLSGKDYGVRRGVMPLFLAEKLAGMGVAAVIYAGERELEACYEVLNKVNERPEHYELYLEPETAEKERYLQKLEVLFDAGNSRTAAKQGRIADIVKRMQGWYRSLPQYAMVTMTFTDGDFTEIRAFRNALKRAEVNPRELLFDRFPQIFRRAPGTECGETSGEYLFAAEQIGRCRTLLEGKLDALKGQIAEEIRNIFGVREGASLKACLKEQYQTFSATARAYILSATAGSFLEYAADPGTNDESEIAAKLSRIVLDLYPEDWKDDTLGQFAAELVRIRTELEGIRDRGGNVQGCTAIIVRDADGSAVEKYFEEGPISSTGLYLKNVISEALEEFGEALDPAQKVAVLAELLREI